MGRARGYSDRIARAFLPGVKKVGRRAFDPVDMESRRFLDGLDTNFSWLRLTPP